MCHSISYIRIGLVAGHVKRSFGVARINAYHRDPHGVVTFLAQTVTFLNRIYTHRMTLKFAARASSATR